MPACRKMCQLLAGAGALFALGGCYKATFVNPSVAPGPEVEEWTDFFLGGLVGHEEIDVRRFCPGEVAMVRTGGNVGTDVITAITLGIYAPRKIYVSCAAAAPVPGLPPVIPESTTPLVVPPPGPPAPPVAPPAPPAEPPAPPAMTPTSAVTR